ncbi:FAD-binding oxidoreductase [Corticibacter populi]|uniref:FAD-binding oxidoreductase n=1 Tax=Corticibacter populi TaxID=1550736 RepID=A0A3M6QLA3_9BURK|nr:FAD-dependent oxidoreductase [Corticibacter populi]RMX03511.1 FAD-binding oxidoreductase [Corticibacter populi]RZS29956.1 sarcosine oxidase subunit beta [Corticibacter populi]
MSGRTGATSTGSDVLVIGGGLQGLSSALQLARRGLRVRLLEAEYCGRHASGVNAGGVRTLGRHVAEIPLALGARRMWHRLRELLGDDGGFVASGQLQVAENAADQQAAQERIAQLQARGFTHEQWIDQQEVHELVPSISPHVVGGIWAADDGYAQPYRVVTAFRLAALRAGVQIHEGAAATTVRRRDGVWQVEAGSARYAAAQLINTAGAWGAELAGRLGDAVPLQPGGLMLMVTQRVAPFVRPVLGAVGRPLSFKQFDNGTVVIGGGLRCEADAAARVAPVDLASMTRSAQTVVDLFPHLRDMQIVRAWAGVEGFLPDQIPVIGFGRASPGVVHAFGFSAHGFELSPIIGSIVADLVEHGSTEWPIAPFAVDRFGAG